MVKFIDDAEAEIRRLYFNKRSDVHFETTYYPRVQRVIIRVRSLFDLEENYTFAKDLITKEIIRL